MGNKRKTRVCPVERAGSLDNKIRRWIQNPLKILGMYVEKGMTVLDVGCGPGFFTIDLAKMVGRSGRVIASDLQEGMLKKLEVKIRGTELEERVTLHKSEQNRIDLSESVDFALLFYMVHEVSNIETLFSELATILKPNGKVLVVEPPFHVSKKAFYDTIQKARKAGFQDAEGPKVFLSKSVILIKRKE